MMQDEGINQQSGHAGIAVLILFALGDTLRQACSLMLEFGKKLNVGAGDGACLELDLLVIITWEWVRRRILAA